MEVQKAFPHGTFHVPDTGRTHLLVPVKTLSQLPHTTRSSAQILQCEPEIDCHSVWSVLADDLLQVHDFVSETAGS